MLWKGTFILMKTKIQDMTCLLYTSKVITLLFKYITLSINI